MSACSFKRIGAATRKRMIRAEISMIDEEEWAGLRSISVVGDDDNPLWSHTKASTSLNNSTVPRWLSKQWWNGPLGPLHRVKKNVQMFV